LLFFVVSLSDKTYHWSNCDAISRLAAARSSLLHEPTQLTQLHIDIQHPINNAIYCSYLFINITRQNLFHCLQNCMWY